MKAGDLAVAADSDGERLDVRGNGQASSAAETVAFMIRSMHSLISQACVAWPLGQDAWPGTGIGGNRAGAMWDGRGRLRSPL